MKSKISTIRICEGAKVARQNSETGRYETVTMPKTIQVQAEHRYGIYTFHALGGHRFSADFSVVQVVETNTNIQD